MIEAFVLMVSLSGNYKDERIAGHFFNCKQAMYYFKSQCSDHKAARCLMKEQVDKISLKAFEDTFSFDIKERQSCGFVGVDKKFYD
jgi:hypothetical protein